MPNWFKNHIALKGEPARLAAFKQAHFKTFEDEPGEHNTFLDFETVLPMPENIKALRDVTISEEEARTASKAALDAHNAACKMMSIWCCENWGARSSGRVLEINPNSPADILEFRLETAWSPPMPAIRKLLQMWPDLTLTEYKGYDEGENNAIEYNMLTGIATVVDEEARNFEGDGPWYCEKISDRGEPIPESLHVH
jgi:hypothetical protein